METRLNDFGDLQIIVQLADDGRKPATFIADMAELMRSTESVSRRTLLDFRVETLIPNADVDQFRLSKCGWYDGITRIRTDHILAAIKMTVDSEQMPRALKRPCTAVIGSSAP